jgi:hypothetical protein
MPSNRAQRESAGRGHNRRVCGSEEGNDDADDES